jgi:wyosine [tRNA(Phe)-imidazoG37] synthetase (radical SAM superfamily)
MPVTGMPTQKRIRQVYGPVPSRRLGTSLGVDLVPFKTCTYDCIYCQLGRTTCLTQKRAEYTSADRVLYDLKRALQVIPRPDLITLAGSGEPTLHSGIGDIILGIRSFTPIPVAILTNGSLLGNINVQRDCSLADIVLPSLDAGDEDTFQKVNRSAPGLSFRSLLDGLNDFRRAFKGQIWLEVLLLRGITDNDASVRQIAGCAGEICPDRIHLNTAVRPTAEKSARAVPLSELERFTVFFKPTAQVAFRPITNAEKPGLPLERVLETLGRRPCTLEELAGIMQISPVEVIKIIEKMLQRNELNVVRRGQDIHYTAASWKPADS